MKTYLFCVIALLTLAMAPVETQIQGSVTDPMGDVLDSRGNGVTDRPDLDIVFASIVFVLPQIKFTMRFAGNVLSQPTYRVVYCWGLDLDRNSKTGDPQGDIGNEVNVCVRYEPNQSHSEYGWHGFIDDLVHDAYAKGPLSTFSISGSNIELTIASEALRDPLGIDWIAFAGADLIPGSLGASDRAPDEGHATILTTPTTPMPTTTEAKPAIALEYWLLPILVVLVIVAAFVGYLVGKRKRSRVTAAKAKKTVDEETIEW